MINHDLIIDKTLKISKKEILDDYFLINQSRFLSYIGRKEVFMGRAKFGVFGDGGLFWNDVGFGDLRTLRLWGSKNCKISRI